MRELIERIIEREHLGEAQKILTAKDKKGLPALYSQDGVKDPKVWVKFFNPYGSGTWFATEFDGEDTFFGYVKIHGNSGELGYFSLKEMKRSRIERDMSFTPKLLSKAKADLKKAQGYGEDLDDADAELTESKGKIGSRERNLIGKTKELISTFAENPVNAYERYDRLLEPLVNDMGPAFLKDLKSAGTELVRSVSVSQGGQQVVKGIPFGYVLVFSPRPKLPRNNDFEWKEKEAAYEQWMDTFKKDMKIVESFGLSGDPRGPSARPKMNDYGKPVEWFALRDVANL